MGLFTSMRFDSLEDLFLAQIEDLYDAEKRLTEALPKMAAAADCQKLKGAIQQHLTETEGHVRRLEQIFSQFGRTSDRKTCEAMKGLIKEGDEAAQAEGDCAVRDAAIIAACQRVEHYEMAGYGTARNFAQRLGRADAARLLQDTLDEEGNADKILTEIAEESVNVEAAHA
jgi:ferritin-like metal-binding protein YciE